MDGIDSRNAANWRGLYRVAAVSAFIYVVLIFVPLALLIAFPQPPLAGGAAILEHIASYKAVYLIELVSFVGLSLPAMVVFLALYPALKRLNAGFAALGAVIGVASETMALALGSSPPSLNGGLIHLSNQYMLAAGERRVALAAAAEALLAASNTVNAVGILTALGILILSLVMLKGVFSRPVAFIGITTGAVGMISEALRDEIGMAYSLYGILLVVWFIAVGWKLASLRDA